MKKNIKVTLSSVQILFTKNWVLILKKQDDIIYKKYFNI